MNAFSLRILHPATPSRIRLLPVMHGLTGILFLFNAIGIYHSATPNWALTGLFILLGLASVVFPFVIRRYRKFPAANAIARLLQVFVCLTGSLYFLSHMQPVGGLLLFVVGLGLAYIGWAEYKVFQPVYVKADTTGITVPTAFSARLIGWNQLNNVILRNDLLTLDFKNNKVLQLDVLDEIAPETREAFNNFCKSRT